MFQELYPVAKHTPLQLIVTPRGEQLQVIIIPKPDEDDADKKSALREPISAIGTPAELDAELPAKLARYATRINELRAKIDLPLDAIDAQTQKAGKRKTKPAKKPKAAKAAKTAPSASWRRGAAAAKKKAKPAAAPKPAREIKLPGVKGTKPAKPAARRAAPGTPTPRASLPGKDQCLEDLRAYTATGKDLNRAAFIAWARKNGNKTGRRFEKLWTGWHEFLADGKKPASGAPRQDAPPASNAVGPSASPRKAAAAPEPDSAAKPSKTALNPKAAWPFPTDERGKLKTGVRPDPLRTVSTDTGTLLGNYDKPLAVGDKYRHPEFGEFRVVKVEQDKYTVQRIPETAEGEAPPAAPAGQADLLAGEGGK